MWAVVLRRCLHSLQTEWSPRVWLIPHVRWLISGPAGERKECRGCPSLSTFRGTSEPSACLGGSKGTVAHVSLSWVGGCLVCVPRGSVEHGSCIHRTACVPRKACQTRLPPRTLAEGVPASPKASRAAVGPVTSRSQAEEEADGYIEVTASARQRQAPQRDHGGSRTTEWKVRHTPRVPRAWSCCDDAFLNGVSPSRCGLVEPG